MGSDELLEGKWNHKGTCDDKLLWHGVVFDAHNHTADTEGVREFTRLITTDPNWIASIVPIRDGMMVAHKKP